MANQKILEYIQQAKAEGQSEEKIKSAILDAGWQEKDVNEAFQETFNIILKKKDNSHLWTVPIFFIFFAYIFSIFIFVNAIGGGRFGFGMALFSIFLVPFMLMLPGIKKLNPLMKFIFVLLVIPLWFYITFFLLT